MPKKKVSATQVMVDVLIEAGGPLATAEIVDRALASRRTHLKGKTTKDQTTVLKAVLYKVAGQGRLFKRVDRGVFDLIDREAQSATPADVLAGAVRQRTAKEKSKAGAGRGGRARARATA